MTKDIRTSLRLDEESLAKLEYLRGELGCSNNSQTVRTVLERYCSDNIELPPAYRNIFLTLEQQGYGTKEELMERCIYEGLEKLIRQINNSSKPTKPKKDKTKH